MYSEGHKVKIPPRGWAILAMVGPSIIWCAEYIGSGEVILATRTGAILGPAILWAVVAGIFLKFWIGLSGARYTVTTGEGMIDMFSRIPGPKNWVVWMVMVIQSLTAMLAIGSIASAAGIFLNSMVPVSPVIGGWIITIFCLAVAWSGVFNFLKIIMSLFVLVIIVGVIYVAATALPEGKELIPALKLAVPEVPAWAMDYSGIGKNPWKEILPLLGWGAGGFASQVWYSYWVLGAGYGAANGRPYGEPADTEVLKSYNVTDAKHIKGWGKVVAVDATVGMVIGIVVTSGFLLAGAGILRPMHLAPDGAEVATQLATIFSVNWGKTGDFVFMFSATMALISTQIGQLAGWPRLLADSARICIPAVKRKFSWKQQYRFILVLFFISNMVIVHTFGLKPVTLVKLSAILDGLLLTPLQAVWIGIALYFVMPKMFSREVGRLLKPHWIYCLGLVIAFLVFGYFCVFQIPSYF
ncbi:MAG: Nramp family divalent metal transporter [Prolixibacteraceae bacterium]|nr:Nramp family divalent metal transporter [Prolixibacteraceae bacterium]